MWRGERGKDVPSRKKLSACAYVLGEETKEKSTL